MKPAEQLAELWVNKNLDLEAIGQIDTKPWKTYQTVYFLDKIIEKSPLPDGIDISVAFKINFIIISKFKQSFIWIGNVKKLGEFYPNITGSNNAELKLRWAQIVAKNLHVPEYQHIRKFLTSQVRVCFYCPFICL